MPSQLLPLPKHYPFLQRKQSHSPGTHPRGASQGSCQSRPSRGRLSPLPRQPSSLEHFVCLGLVAAVPILSSLWLQRILEMLEGKVAYHMGGIIWHLAMEALHLSSLGGIRLLH